MTELKPDEAIRELKAMKPHIESHMSIVGHDAYDMAISALEKQMPKKAIGEQYAHMRCPSCNHRIPSGGGSSSRRRDNWCNYCGQAIDWEENEQ